MSARGDDGTDPRLYTDAASVRAAAAVVGQEIRRWRTMSSERADSPGGQVLQESAAVLAAALTGYAEAMSAAEALWQRAGSDDLRHEAVAAAGRARSRLRKCCVELTAACRAAARSGPAGDMGLQDAGRTDDDG
ncbi:hypothetical protein SAMN05421595_0881 [Austwickia chelonae]|uniref:Uncharacterized protein n=1 Tax=Austwickia chelonae NBRC 105200 TaxID=1184607 RepID=K6VNP2_9MICO|nr:hypothetical protein [Austwickia chelonae]GAB78364.1 hypothetical protein AUCHE_08_06110 [Austwickia chelonae NBRC 105200]SEW02083.1 hypothetical protein SAMN05421595_0881 [Austwickia chelonae]